MICLAGRSGPALEVLRANNAADLEGLQKVYKPEAGRPFIERVANKFGQRAFGAWRG